VVVLGVLGMLVLSGCGRLRFDPPSDGVPELCPETCIADAAAAFDGTSDGADSRWRYVGDRRDRTWQPMAAVSNIMVGESENRIERCADKPQAKACRALPGALLITSSGASNASDPAIAYVASEARVVRLSLHVHVPGDGVAHRIRLYRNSREDVLFTTSSSPGATVAYTITLDALPGDRFVVALEAQDVRGSAAALHLFVSDSGTAFPSSCELALGFSDPDIVGTAIDDRCGGAFASLLGTAPVSPALIDGPFAEHGMGIYLESDLHLAGPRPFLRDASTIQFWVRMETMMFVKATVFSDIDENSARGLLIQVDATSGFQLEAAVVTATDPVTYASQRIAFANPTTWHFVRVVRADGLITFCLDGARVTSLPLPGSTAPGLAPTLGRNGPWNPRNEMVGSIDDIRVFSTALPCDEQ
jgi:hypothetical protein